MNTIKRKPLIIAARTILTIAFATGLQPLWAQEGIKVHGHWTIEVRDANGKLVAHSDFENALQATGSSYLVNCLGAGCTVPSNPVSIRLNGSPAQPCGAGGTNPCRVTGIDTITGSALEVDGTVTATTATTITQVMTVLVDNSGVEHVFTAATLSTGSANPPISVAQGQIVQVKVVINFS